jgi:DNA-binding NarL/FixJ family response regulator
MAHVDFTMTGHRHPRRPHPVLAGRDRAPSRHRAGSQRERGLAIERLTAAYRVSRREFEVLRLVSVGRTNREIVKAALFVGPRTVDMHVSNLLMKLGCRSRTEATHRAAELGLLDNSS